MTVSESLRSLRTNEQLCANCSGCSWQKSNCERIAQSAHDKRATVSDLLRLLMRIAHLLFCSKNLNKIEFFVPFLSVYSKPSDWLIPSFLKSDVSKLLRSLMTKELLWANRSSCSPKMSNRERFALIAHKKWATVSKSLRSLIYSPKTSDLLRKPMSEFLTLNYTVYIDNFLTDIVYTNIVYTDTFHTDILYTDILYMLYCLNSILFILTFFILQYMQ